MPDRYLVTHGITKDVKNEDLRDFLQESIEECFQILDNGMYDTIIIFLLYTKLYHLYSCHCVNIFLFN